MHDSWQFILMCGRWQSIQYKEQDQCELLLNKIALPNPTYLPMEEPLIRDRRQSVQYKENEYTFLYETKKIINAILTLEIAKSFSIFKKLWESGTLI